MKSEYDLRIDWSTIDRVIESIRQRIFEITLPTEREIVISKFGLDDPLREKLPRKPMCFSEVEESEPEEAQPEDPEDPYKMKGISRFDRA